MRQLSLALSLSLAFGLAVGFRPPGAHGEELANAALARTLTLDQALQELDTQNLTLAQARSRAAEAASVVRQAAAALLPSLNAAGSYTRNSDDAAIPMGLLLRSLPGAPANVPNEVVIQPLDSFTASASLRVPVVVPSAWADLAAARDAAESAGAATKATRLQLRAALAQSAWLATSAEEMVQASERAVETAEEHSRSASRSVQAGTAAPLSVLKADTEVAKRQSDLARARADLGRVRLALGILLGRVEPVRIVPGAAPEIAGDTAALAGEALRNRPELSVLAAQVHAAEHQVDSARLRVAPQLQATASAFVSDEPLPTGKKDGWRATVDLAWPMYDGGYRYGKRRQAEATVAAARAAVELQRLAIAQEVADALRELEVARERLRLAERQRQFAVEAAASAKRTFEAGVAGSLEVLDANDRLYQADVALAEARGRLGASQVAVARAVGRGP